jgi:phasin
MSEQDLSRKFADKATTIANETLERGKPAAEQSADAIEKSYSTAVENMREYNRKMIDMAHTNAEVAFDLARQLATAKGPSDIMELLALHARKQFEMLSEQTRELAALGQKMAGKSAEPIVRSVNQVFKKVS